MTAHWAKESWTDDVEFSVYGPRTPAVDCDAKAPDPHGDGSVTHTSAIPMDTTQAIARQEGRRIGDVSHLRERLRV